MGFVRSQRVVEREAARFQSHVSWLRQIESPVIKGLSIAVGLIVWQLVHTHGASIFVPSVPDVVRALIAYVSSTDFITDALTFLLDVGLGFTVAAATGILVGALMGISSWIEAVLNPYVTFFYVTPISGIVPLLILWLGFGVVTHLTVVFLFAVFPVIVNTYQAVKNTPAELVMMARAFGAQPVLIFRQVIMPAAVPYVIAGLRLGVIRAITGLILAQLIISPFGFGERLMKYTARFQMAPAFAVLVVIMIFSMLIALVIQQLEQWMAPWRSVERGL